MLKGNLKKPIELVENFHSPMYDLLLIQPDTTHISSLLLCLASLAKAFRFTMFSAFDRNRLFLAHTLTALNTSLTWPAAAITLELPIQSTYLPHIHPVHLVLHLPLKVGRTDQCLYLQWHLKRRTYFRKTQRE